jgi:hypothetical protein
VPIDPAGIKANDFAFDPATTLKTFYTARGIMPQRGESPLDRWRRTFFFEACFGSMEMRTCDQKRLIPCNRINASLS